nr:hypothetical protein [Actinomadura macra]
MREVQVSQIFYPESGVHVRLDQRPQGRKLCGLIPWLGDMPVQFIDDTRQALTQRGVVAGQEDPVKVSELCQQVWQRAGPLDDGVSEPVGLDGHSQPRDGEMRFGLLMVGAEVRAADEVCFRHSQSGGDRGDMGAAVEGELPVLDSGQESLAEPGQVGKGLEGESAPAACPS